VRSDRGRVPSLGDDAVRELGVVRVDLLGAVVLVVVLASLALEAREDLGADADSLADLELGHLVADMRNFADDLVAGADPVGAERTPAAGDGVDVGTAHA